MAIHTSTTEFSTIRILFCSIHRLMTSLLDAALKSPRLGRTGHARFSMHAQVRARPKRLSQRKSLKEAELS
jgi:hypothetical protein